MVKTVFADDLVLQVGGGGNTSFIVPQYRD